MKILKIIYNELYNMPFLFKLLYGGGFIAWIIVVILSLIKQ